MNRRTLLRTMGAGVVAAPLAASAQQPGRVWRIGLFHVGLDHVPPALHGLRERLKDLGYEEGKNLRWDFRNLPDESGAQETAQEFVHEKVDVIVAFENQTVRAAKAATSQVPILFLHVLTDPVGEGFVQSLAHPGGNITGIFGDVTGKRVELLKEAVPNPNRLLLLFDPADHTALQELTAVRTAARALKLRLVERAAVTQGDIERVLMPVRRENIQALVVVSGLVTKFPALVIRLAAERRLPIPGHRKEWAEQGALFSYGANYFSVGRIDAARLVDRLPPVEYRPAYLAGLTEFIQDHRTHGSLTGKATEPEWNGYLLTVACSCGVTFERWITPCDAELDLLRMAGLN